MATRGRGDQRVANLKLTRLALELATIVILVVAGSLLGGITGILALAPILGMALPLAAATVFLHSRGATWRDAGFPIAMNWKRFLRLALGTAAAVILLTSFVLTPLLQALGMPPPDTSVLVELIEGNTANYLLFLIPVAWGSAAFGEELLFRGFVMHRLSEQFGARWGVLLQALLFALGHAYQGVSGVVSLLVVGLIFGYAFLRAGGNLWPVIVAHGLIDTLSITLAYLGFGTTR